MKLPIVAPCGAAGRQIMSTSTLSHTDLAIQQAVEAELSWVPEVDEAGIGVAVEDGTVTLSGDVDTYRERVAAVAAAQRVRGVTTVADDLRVHPTAVTTPPTDADIAAALHRSFEWTSDVPDTVKAEVRDHYVTLTGQAAWEYQRAAAARIAERTRGVFGVTNSITLTQRVSATDVSKRIRDAMARNAALDAKTITVTSAGGVVTLTGTVRSWSERVQAGRAAWASPHVTNVQNRLIVKSY